MKYGRSFFKAITSADIHSQATSSLLPSKFSEQDGLVTIGFNQIDYDLISDALLSTSLCSITSIANFSDNIEDPKIIIPIRSVDSIDIVFDLTILIFGLSDRIQNLGVTVGVHNCNTYQELLQCWYMEDWILKVHTDLGNGTYSIGYPKILRVTGFINTLDDYGNESYSIETNLLGTSGIYYELSEN